jgi:hypothetical protein
MWRFRLSSRTTTQFFGSDGDAGPGGLISSAT